MRVLVLSGCTALSSFSGLESMPPLTHLFVENCHAAGAASMISGPQLEYVAFTRCPQLTGLSLSLPSESGEAVRSATQQSGVVRVSECPLIARVVIPPHFPLKEFTASNTRFGDLRILRACVALAHLDVHGCSRLTDITPLLNLQTLRSVDVSDTAATNPLATLSRLPQLTELRVNGCFLPNDLRELATAVSLKVIEAARTQLESLEGLADCVLLERVRVSHCPRLINVSALFTLPHLTFVDVSFTPIRKLRRFKSFHMLEEMYLAGCRNLKDFALWSDLERARSLRVLDLHYSDIRRIAVWKTCPASLQRLNLKGCRGVKDIVALSVCKKLEDLDISETGVNSLGPLKGCVAHLKRLCIARTRVNEIDALRGAAQLETLLSRETAVQDITPLLGCASVLKVLDLSYTKVRDISVLCGAERLEDLHLNGTGVTDLSALAACAPSLKYLYVDDCAVREITVLAKADNLEKLSISNTSVTDLSPLRGCLPVLELLDLSKSKVENISLLGDAQNLKLLDLRHLRKVNGFFLQVRGVKVFQRRHLAPW